MFHSYAKNFKPSSPELFFASDQRFCWPRGVGNPGLDTSDGHFAKNNPTMPILRTSAERSAKMLQLGADLEQSLQH